MAAPTPGLTHAPHIGRIDVLRALAFLSVFSFHFMGAFPSMKVTWNGLWLSYANWPPALYALLPIAFGWLGVPLFFVLSGFCIHYSTLKRKTTFGIGDFYWRRFLRIYPAYFVCVLVSAALAPWLPVKYFNGWQVLTHLLMIHNFAKMTFEGLNGPLWSLAVEAQFYLLYPFLLLFLRRRLSWGGCLGVALALNAVLQIYFSLTSRPWPYEMNHTRTTFSFPLVTWCDWILGAALAEAYVEGKPLFTRPILWFIGSTAMLVVALNFRPLYVQGYLFGSVFFAVIVQQYLSMRTPLRTIERGLIPIGLISYSLYLWHAPVLLLTRGWGQAHHLDRSPLAYAFYNLAVAAAVLIPLAWLSYRFLEIAVPRWLALRAARRKREPLAANAAVS